MLRRFCVLSTLMLLAAVALLSGCGGPEPTPVRPPATPAPPTLPNPSATAAPLPTTAPPPTAPPASETPAPTGVPAPTEAPAANPPAPAVPPSHYFGASTNGEILYDEKVRALATLAGVQMVRTSAEWASIEKVKGEYDWGGLRATLKTLVENNFAPLVLILENPDWAATTHCGPVNDLAAFDRFVRELVRQNPEVLYWALSNEPDDAGYPGREGAGCYGAGDLNENGKPDVEDYAEQLRVAWRAVHDTNPRAQLGTGALAFDNFDEATAPPGYPGAGKGGKFNANFPSDLFRYIAAHPLPNGDKYFDILSFNFYQIYGPYWERQAGGNGISAKANMLNRLMSEAGIRAPLLVSETGEDSYVVGTQKQSEYISKTYARGLASGIVAVVWWTFQDFPDSNPPPSNTWKYGLIDQAQVPKPAYAAYQTASQQLTGATYLQPLAVQGGEGYLFNKDGGGKAVLWSASDAPVTVAFAAAQVQVTDMYGAQKVIADGSPDDHDAAAGRIGVQVEAAPVFVQVAAQ